MHIESNSRTTVPVEFATIESSSEKGSLILSTWTPSWRALPRHEKFPRTRVSSQKSIHEIGKSYHVCKVSYRPYPRALTRDIRSVNPKFSRQVQSSTHEISLSFLSIKYLYVIHSHEIIGTLSLSNQRTVASRVRRIFRVGQVRCDQSRPCSMTWSIWGCFSTGDPPVVTSILHCSRFSTSQTCSIRGCTRLGWVDLRLCSNSSTACFRYILQVQWDTSDTSPMWWFRR